MLLSFGRVLAWTVALGFLSFAIGFFGPILLAPDANQGPLLGIFITGPLGTVAGFVVGLVREYLGYTAGPLEVALGWWPGDGSHFQLIGRSLATLGGGALAAYGFVSLMDGGGRGAAAAIVLAAAIIHYGVSGQAPRWFRR